MTSTETASFDARKLSFKKRVILFVAPILAGLLVRTLYLLNRKSTQNPDIWNDLLTDGEPFLCGVWHENFVTLLPRFGEDKIDALTSRSFDGELAARLLARFGLGSFRGSSSRGGAEALNAMVKKARNLKVLGLTIDGPRGPRRCAKPGIAILSMRTQLRVVPLAATATRCIRLKSWDRTCIPLPFGRYVYAIGDPIDPLPQGSDRDAVRAKTQEIESALNAMQAAIESEYRIDPRFKSD